MRHAQCRSGRSRLLLPLQQIRVCTAAIDGCGPPQAIHSSPGFPGANECHSMAWTLGHPRFTFCRLVRGEAGIHSYDPSRGLRLDVASCLSACSSRVPPVPLGSVFFKGRTPSNLYRVFFSVLTRRITSSWLPSPAGAGIPRTPRVGSSAARKLSGSVASNPPPILRFSMARVRDHHLPTVVAIELRDDILERLSLEPEPPFRSTRAFFDVRPRPPSALRPFASRR